MQYLFLGLGEVGLEVASDILKNDPLAQIHVHTKSNESLQKRISLLQSRFKTAKITSSFGDLFASKESLNELNIDPTLQKFTLDYIYNYKSSEWYRSSLIYHLIEKVKPDAIIDTVTLATYFKSDDLYQLYLKYQAGRHCDITDLFLRDPSMILTAFVQSLAHGMREFSTQHYVKVSTSGFGGMGFNCPYTHSSDNSERINLQMQNKISSTGILHQLLWNLYDSEKLNINLIIPKALIGWESPSLEKNKDTLKVYVKSFDGQSSDSVEEVSHLTFVRIPCGDSTSYSKEEVILAGANGQFETITKEEVSKAVLGTLSGNPQYNVLLGMELASMKSSYRARQKMDQVIFAARSLEESLGLPSVTSKNFGPLASKLITELYVIFKVTGGIQSLQSVSEEHIAFKVNQYFFENKYIRNQIIFSGMVILTDNQYYYSRLEQELLDFVNKNLIVDLSRKNILEWKNICQKILVEQEKEGPNLYEKFDDQTSVGEIIARYFILNGKCRKQYLY